MENSIVYDLILLEADRVIAHRKKNLDLYYKDIHGSFEKIGEAYDQSVEEMISALLKRRKMRYLITFVDAIELQDELKPSAHKILRFFTKVMNYGNVVKGYGFKDIFNATGINTHFITSGINQLLEKDIVRFRVEKGRRIYMINPIFFYKGSMKKIFGAVKAYDKYPKFGAPKEQEKNIFE